VSERKKLLTTLSPLPDEGIGLLLEAASDDLAVKPPFGGVSRVLNYDKVAAEEGQDLVHRGRLCEVEIAKNVSRIQ
jgi:hypothetical protein